MDPDAFRTTTDLGVTAVTAEEMRDVDHVAIETYGLSLLQMIEPLGIPYAPPFGHEFAISLEKTAPPSEMPQ
ncbi:hypothetical protein [Natronorubrum thiooxidans]|uniref:Uncharacterized protein n=1 Tax=Natronorubrum thiooxidans TaxID=308853 RepID=A0A1N7GZX7_9EURY|nr:hypothetical protein [Natronorubrum thiooxidans]SIS18154.1 hypothetical protein SAMN05421752_11928 [Natronorubrum thiooxidans]